MEEVRNTCFNNEETKEMRQELPPKLGDPGSFLISCTLNDHLTYDALADLGASINLMPYSIYLKLNLGNLKPTTMSIRLADRSFQHPKGMSENMLIRVGTFTFPVDFVVLDMEEDLHVPLILGRPFLNTADAIIHVKDKEITIGIGESRLSFQINEFVKHSYSYDETCFRMDVTDNTLSEVKELVNPPADTTNEPSQWELEHDPDQPQGVDIEELEEWMENFTVEDWSDEEAYHDEMRAITTESLSIMKIRNFEQGDNETIKEAWNRMKTLVADCQELVFEKEDYIQLFYHGLFIDAQEILDITSEEGFFLMYTPDECYDFLEEERYNMENQESEEGPESEDKEPTIPMELRLFQQKEEESINEAWIRWKSLVVKYLDLDIDHYHYFRCFYIGLQVESQDILDTYSKEEFFLMKDPETCFQFLENKRYLEEYPEEPEEEPEEEYPEKPEEDESDPEEGPLPEKDSTEESTEPEVTYQMLIDLLDQQSMAFKKLQDELEDVRAEFRVRNRIDYTVKRNIESKLDTMLEIQRQSPFGQFRETDTVHFSTFVHDLFHKRKCEDEIETEMAKKQRTEHDDTDVDMPHTEYQSPEDSSVGEPGTPGQ